MNKYQKVALTPFIFRNEFGLTISDKTSLITKRFTIENDAILIYADRDIFSKNYTVLLLVRKSLRVQVLFDKDWIELERKTVSYIDDKSETNTKAVGCENKEVKISGAEFKINLDNKPTKVKLIPPGHVVEDIILDIKYDEMSEEEYWAVQNSPAVLREKMGVTFRTGDDLVNVYWKHAKQNDVAMVRVDLYMGCPDNAQLMAKYKVSDEVFFKSITGLAYGEYCFKVYQFDKDDNEIVSTDFIKFELKKPQTNTHTGKPTVWI